VQFVIPVCLFQLVISEADPTQGALLFLLLYYQQAPPGPALQDSATSALYRAPGRKRFLWQLPLWFYILAVHRSRPLLRQDRAASEVPGRGESKMGTKFI
jgi:hypothetical protein